MKGSVVVGRRKIEITNPGRILFPRSKITKGDLITYYHDVAPLMIPLIKNHPITMHRFPEGIKTDGFYQKNTPDYFPSWIKTVSIKHTEGKVDYIICNDPATLVYLANQACIVIHPWLSAYDKLDYPDRMVFDLDPSTKDFSQVQDAAFHLKEILEEYDLTSFVMTTGSRGVHVIVPLQRRYTFDQVADCAKFCAHRMVQEDPKAYTLEIRKQKRGKKIFIDTLRNRWSALSVAPYSVRAKEGAPIACPITWKQLADTKLTPDHYRIDSVKRLLARKDPWKNFLSVKNGLGHLVSEVQ